MFESAQHTTNVTISLNLSQIVFFNINIHLTVADGHQWSSKGAMKRLQLQEENMFVVDSVSLIWR